VLEKRWLQAAELAPSFDFNSSPDCIIFGQTKFSSWGRILVALHHGEAKPCFQSLCCFSVIQPD
jgi:hypothetical protein